MLSFHKASISKYENCILMFKHVMLFSYIVKLLLSSGTLFLEGLNKNKPVIYYGDQILEVVFKDPVFNYTALLWQKEASDIPSKFELLMFSYFAYCTRLPGQIVCINTRPAKKYVR